MHIGELPPGQAEELVAVCEALVAEGLIRGYGWSTDDVACAEVFAGDPHCWVIQHDLNVLEDAAQMLDLCHRHDLASLNRSPLAMGLLSDKVTTETRFPPDTIRGAGATVPGLAGFIDGRPAPEFLVRRDAIRDVLTSDGRTLTQGALAWIWARGPHTVPLPGCRTPAQVEESAAAIARGPLTPDQMDKIERILRVSLTRGQAH